MLDEADATAVVRARLDLETAGVADLGAAMAARRVTAVDLVRGYLARIAAYDVGGPALNSVRTLAPDALEQARALDEERAARGPRGPLHGIPVLVKDNIDVAGLPTTAGSLALVDSVPDRDAFAVMRLREAGAVILGKTNLTELANFMTDRMPSGYSSVGGQVLNPYDVSRTPCGSSSGSGVAAAMGFATVTVGTETDGSILCPCDAMSLVGVKPTVGLVSRTGILPIAASQDTAGPMARTVTDAAALLTALAGVDHDDPAWAEGFWPGVGGVGGVDYRGALDPTALAGTRLAVPPVPEDLDPDATTLFATALAVLADRGAELVRVPALVETDETEVLRYELRRDLQAYLDRLPADAPVRTVADLVAFNHAHAQECLKFGQTHLEAALALDLAADQGAYRARRRRDGVVAGELGVDAVLGTTGAAAIVAPSWRGAGVGARAGYPSVIVPAGYRAGTRAPFGVMFLGTVFSEATLLGFAYDFEQATRARRPVSAINPSLVRPRLL